MSDSFFETGRPRLGDLLLSCIEPWDEATLDGAGGAGGGARYVATEDVRRVDLSKISWLAKGAQS